MKKIIQVKNIYKSYKLNGKLFNILDKVSLDVTVGQTLSIVGTSGIGKSTLLHIIGTLDKPDSGKVLYKKKDISLFDDAELASFRNKTIGFIFQFHHLLNDFSTLENTMMPALIARIPQKIAKKKAKKLLIKVGMKDRMNQMTKQLSGGERQRVAIARALIQKPDVLLADEPTGNLDKKNSDSIQKLLLTLNDEFGMTIILVTHSNILASSMSKKITLLEGKLIEIQ